MSNHIIGDYFKFIYNESIADYCSRREITQEEFMQSPIYLFTVRTFLMHRMESSINRDRGNVIISYPRRRVRLVYIAECVNKVEYYGADRVAQENEEVCYICCTNSAQVVSESCGHSLGCFSCANNAFIKKCPLCRKSLLL